MNFSPFPVKLLASLLFAPVTTAGTILWDGRFNTSSTTDSLASWSWSNQVGAYQYYIHGSDEVSSYISLASDFKNPSDKDSGKGARITLDKTSYWEGQTMRRTELIPQTDAKINEGSSMFYHFSMMHKNVNPLNLKREHQIMFFESHFTEFQYGGSSDTAALLTWMANSKAQWNASWEEGVWHNMAYEIDFSVRTVGLWHSTGGAALTRVVAPVSASVSSNGADWHVGMLELPTSGVTDTVEDLYVSGVYIETGKITTNIGTRGPSSASSSSARNDTSTDKINSASTVDTATQATYTPGMVTSGFSSGSADTSGVVISATSSSGSTLSETLSPTASSTTQNSASRQCRRGKRMQ